MNNENIFKDLRNQTFNVKPEDMNVILERENQVYAAVVDIKLNKSIFTLFCGFDGTVSIYSDSSSTIIGLGNNENIKQKAISFLISSGQCIKVLKKESRYELSLNKDMQVFLFAKNGIYKAEITRNPSEKKELKFLDFLVQNVLTEIRRVYKVLG